MRFKEITDKEIELSFKYKALQVELQCVSARLATMTRIADSKARRIAVLEYQIANPSSEVKALDDEQRQRKPVVYGHTHESYLQRRNR